MSESSHGNCVMYRTFGWRGLIEEIAGPPPSYGGQANWFWRAARATGLSVRQIEALWREECKDPKFSISIKVLSAAVQARREATETATRFENAAGALSAKDKDFYGSDILALIEQARRIRGMGRAE